jgi:hypothetical protein
MIQFDKDGVTLFYIDATGKRISHYFMEGTAYNDMLTVMDAQIQAERDNTATIATYERTLTDMENNGQYDPVPSKPLQKIVSDTGAVTFAPFVPPLRDLVVPKAAPSSGLIAAVVPDKNAIMYNMILAMFRKMFPEA